MMTFSFRLLFALAGALLLSAAGLRAQIPQMIAYQGRVSAGGVNFHGIGQFKFAIVNGAYGGNVGETAILWSNDGSLAPTAANGVPTAAVHLTCDRGLYSVLLGNTAAGMVAVPPAAFAMADVRLRVWFNDGPHGWQQLTPDQRLVSVGYAMMAASAQTVPDASINSLKLANGAVTAGKLADNSVLTGNLTDSSVTAAKLAADAVDTNKILDGTIRSADILDGTVAAADLAAGAVTGAKLAAAAVSTAQIADASITAAKLVAASVGSTALADSAVTSAKILDGAIATADLANGSVTGAKMAAATITTQELANGAVSTAKIQGGAVGTQELANVAVTSAKIASGAVGNQELANFAVTSAKIAGNAVGSAEIANLSVATADLADLGVTNAKLAAGAVTAAKIAGNAITSNELANGGIQNIDLAFNVIETGEIVDGAVQTQDLANSAVTAAKLAVLPVCKATLAADYVVIPAFSGFGAGTYIPWSSEEYDPLNMHATTAPADTSLLTAPVKGVYRLSTTIGIDGFVAGLRIRAVSSGQWGGSRQLFTEEHDSAAINCETAATEIALNAGDTVYIYVEINPGPSFETGRPVVVRSNASNVCLSLLSPLP